MSLEIWKRNKRIRPIPFSPADVRNQVRAAEHDLETAETAGLSAAWRLTIAYEAARKFASAALAATGYRVGGGAGHHYYTIQSLRYTVKLAPQTVRLLDAFREKRNDIAYDTFTPPGEKEASEMLELAHAVRDEVVSWLRRTHPETLPR